MKFVNCVAKKTSFSIVISIVTQTDRVCLAMNRARGDRSNFPMGHEQKNDEDEEEVDADGGE